MGCQMLQGYESLSLRQTGCIGGWRSAWKNRFCCNFRTRNQNGRCSTCSQEKGSITRTTLMQLWSVKIEGAHVNHQWKISRSRCSPGLWIWNSRAHVNHRLDDNLNRERGLERSGGYRDCNGFLARRTTRIDGSQPLYSSPAWSWGSQINIWFPHDVES